MEYELVDIFFFMMILLCCRHGIPGLAVDSSLSIQSSHKPIIVFIFHAVILIVTSNVPAWNYFVIVAILIDFVLILHYGWMCNDDTRLVLAHIN
jgi:hypothetical protein